VPTVCSSIAAEGIPADETGLVVCSDPQDWVTQIVALYEDEKRWKTLSELGLSAAKNRYSFESGLQAMQNLVKAWLPVER
jgi:glycosyltransferase involved in cell wall biosynthesis